MEEEIKKKRKGVRLTGRDLNIIKWINSHRAATTEQVRQKFDMSLLSAKKRLYELKSFEYLIYEKIFHEKPGVYRVGNKGIAVTTDELPPVRIRLGSYEHDLQLVDLAIALEKKTGARWQTDRQIRHEKGLEGVGNKGHSPDGILFLPSGEKIAIELELSAKGTKRLEKILRDYSASSYKEVWYFVGSQSIASKILSFSFPSLKVYSLSNMQEIKAEAKQQTIEKAETDKRTKTTEQKLEKKTMDFFRRK
jgi:hypothetical protein